MPTTTAPRDGETSDWATRLRGQGLRVTRQRVAVLAAIAAQPHASVDELHARAAESCPGLTPQAVYVMLDGLEAHGLVRRLGSSRGPARFELDAGDNHHHLECVACGRVVDVACASDAPCLHPADAHGFEAVTADVRFRGRCPDCRPEVSAQPAAAHH